MNTLYRHIIIGVAGLLSAYTVSAQEMLVNLSENPHAQPQPDKHRSSLVQNAPDLLSLPFVDDFASSLPWPNENLWTTNGVYVNNHYAIDMPTIGVATFDALDSKGHLYEWMSGSPSPADSLVSLPIDLLGTSNVMLSFFFQPGGLGDIPGTMDTLKLEFYSPSVDQWTTMWYAIANVADSTITEYNGGLADITIHKFDTINTRFVYTAIELGPEWLQTGFQFRFVNFVSLTVNTEIPGRSNNADFWHLDFVYLDKNRFVDNPNLPDVGVAWPQSKMTIGYSSIPAYHLGSSLAGSIFPQQTTFTIAYRNLGWGTKNVTRRFSINPLYGAGAASMPASYSGGAENIFDNQLQVRTYQFEPYAFTASADDAAFELSSYLVIDVDPTPLRAALRQNDTTKYIQEFHDYYSYDDSSAENGYGLFGFGTGGGRVAVQFAPVMADSLRGVYMYFNVAKDSANMKPFNLAVWDDDDGSPGRLLLSQRVDRPAVRDSLNAYVAYKFAKPISIRRNQVFYIGWTQTTEAFLNIGFDANTLNGSKNFYSLSSTDDWYQSIYDGALMIRPIFCKPENFPSDFVPPPVEETGTASDDYIVYPNPATDWIYIYNKKYDETGMITPRQRIDIFDMSGRVLRTGYSNDGSFSVGDLIPGMYIVRIMEHDKVKASRKIIVN
jgi:hypothetical protein